MDELIAAFFPALSVGSPKETTSDAATSSVRLGDEPSRAARAYDRRSANPLAVALLDYVARGTAEEQAYVFRASARVLGVPLDETRAEAADAVLACAGALGKSDVPSRSEYRAWFEREPAWRGWPSDHVVATAFGGRWTELRTELDGKPAADLRALGLGSLGPARRPDALLRGIRRWHAECPDHSFRFDSFREWALGNLSSASRPAAESSVVDRPSVEFALSPQAYITRFGSWIDALHEAGVLKDAPFDEFCRLTRGIKDYTDERLLQTLRDANEWTKSNHQRVLTLALLDRYRAETLRANWDNGNYAPIPSGETIATRFGSLPQAMLAADIIDSAEALRRTARRGVKLELTTLAAHMKVCAAQCGVPSASELSKNGYSRWRNRLVKQLREPVPSAITVIERMGATGWSEAAMIAAATATDHGEVAALTKKYAAALEAARDA